MESRWNENWLSLVWPVFDLWENQEGGQQCIFDLFGLFFRGDNTNLGGWEATEGGLTPPPPSTNRALSLARDFGNICISDGYGKCFNQSWKQFSQRKINITFILTYVLIILHVKYRIFGFNVNVLRIQALKWNLDIFHFSFEYDRVLRTREPVVVLSIASFSTYLTFLSNWLYRMMLTWINCFQAIDWIV